MIEIITHISYCIIFGIMGYFIIRNYTKINMLNDALDELDEKESGK